MRVALEEAFGRIQRDSRQRRFGERVEVSSGGAVDGERALETVANAVHRIGRGVGVLEDQLHFRGVLQRALGSGGDVRTFENQLSRGGLHDAREHAREHGLSRPAFTDDRGDVTLHQVETHVVNRTYQARGVA